MLGLGQEEVPYMRVGELGGMEKKGVETKMLKMRGKLGKGIGALNKGGRGGGEILL